MTREPSRSPFSSSVPSRSCLRTQNSISIRPKGRGCVIASTQHYFRDVWQYKLGVYHRAHLSRCNKHIRSLDTFSFFETSFLRCSTVFLPFRLIEKLPPVVVCMFSVMSVDCGEPHPYTSVPVARSIFYTYSPLEFTNRSLFQRRTS